MVDVLVVLCFWQGKGSQLQSTSMLMTYSKKELSGSINLAKATRGALRKFFTRRRCPPKGWVGNKPKLETKLLHQFSNHVETWQTEILEFNLNIHIYPIVSLTKLAPRNLLAQMQQLTN